MLNVPKPLMYVSFQVESGFDGSPVLTPYSAEATQNVLDGQDTRSSGLPGPTGASVTLHGLTGASIQVANSEPPTSPLPTATHSIVDGQDTP
jgi:hypothetical protein